MPSISCKDQPPIIGELWEAGCSEMQTLASPVRFPSPKSNATRLVAHDKS
jgi:hypothetical protein